MKHLNNYILKNISINFFSIFIPLFVIASVVFLIRVSSITSIIEINLFEMFKLYLFILPDLLFYTLPLSFFIGGVLTFNKLSFDSEMVVIFSLGVPPNFILNILLKLALFLSIFLIFNSMVIIPHTKQMYKEFVQFKKQEAVLNIKATEFGQKFGDWSIFIKSIDESGKDTYYHNIALFYKKGNEDEKFVVAEKAMIKTSDGMVKLYLQNGSLFSYKRDKMSKVFFQNMKINDLTSANKFKYKSTLEYFDYSLNNKKRKVKLIANLLLSVFPLMSIFLILSIGIQNMRYGKGITNLFIATSILFYYLFTFTLSKSIHFYAFYLIPLWFITSYFIYFYRVTKRY